MFTTEMFHNLT